MEESNDNQVVMFPHLAQGHFIPFVALAKILSGQGLKVTLVTTTANASNLQTLVRGTAPDSNIRLLSLPLPPVDGLPAGCESMDVISPSQIILLFSACRKLSAPFENLMSGQENNISQKPLCIISDVFHCYWLMESASKLGIPCAVFDTMGALGGSMMQYLGTNNCDDIVREREIIEIRDHSLDISLRRTEVPTYFRSDLPHYAHAAAAREMLRKSYVEAKESCAATLVNTFDAIEGAYLKYLEESTGKPVWGVASYSCAEGEEILHESDYRSWLEIQKPRSVLYIAFGSQGALSEAQIQALAKGIEASKEPFLWAIQDLPGKVSYYDFLPEGFVEATRDRGMVTRGGVSQKVILSHPSIGCFLGHCGWNSTLESTCAGVPMAVWPMAFDQFLNARLVVEELRMGLRVSEGNDQVLCSDIVESTVKAAMGESEELLKRAQDVKGAIDNGRASESNVRAFLSFIRSLPKG